MTSAELAFQERYRPAARSIGFVRAPLGDCVSAHVRWFASIGRDLRPRPTTGGFSGVVDGLEPFTMGATPRYGWVSTRAGDWAAIIDCGWRGPDIGGTVSVLARREGWRTVDVTLSIPAADDPNKYGWPATMLSVYGPDGDGPRSHVRTLYAANDAGRWQWGNVGEPFDFEDVTSYQAKRVADRFTRSHLETYCAALGIEPFDDSFYGDAGVVVEYDAVRPPGFREYARAELSRYGRGACDTGAESPITPGGY